MGGLSAHGALLVFIFSFYGFPAELIVVVEVTLYLINILLEVIYGLILAIPNMKNIILFLIAKKRRINSGKYQNGLVKKLNFLLILKR